MSLRNSFSVSFLCESSRRGKDGLSPIYVSLSVNGKRVRFPVQRKADPDTFYKQLRSKKSNEVKDFCRAIEEKLYKIQTDLISGSIPVTTQTLLTYFRSGGVKSYTLEDLWNEYLEVLRPRVGVSLTEDTYKRYETARDIMYSKFGKSCEVSSLRPSSIKSIYDELRTGNYVSTASAKVQKMKSALRYAFENGYIKSNPGAGVKLDKHNKPAVYLTDQEIEKIYTHDFSYNKRLEGIRDLLILQASCGLSFSDLQDLRKEDIREQDGTYFISKTRNKTKVQYTAVILPRGVEVLKKYDMGIPKVISNQKFNAYVKEIATLCDINKDIHSHAFRHTYATELIRRGVDLYTTSRCLGHTNLKQSQHYARLLDETIVKNVSKTF